MPELPEVETVRRGLEPAMVGRVFARVETRRRDLRFPLPERMAERLQGRALEHLGRRSKYLIARVSGGDVLIMHLGMSGRFTITPCEVRRTDAGAQSRADRPSSGRWQSQNSAGDARASAPHPNPLPIIASAGQWGEGTVGAFAHETGADPKHDHVVFEMEAASGRRLRGASSGLSRIVYNDPRRFGFMLMVPEAEFESHPLIRDLGPEPLGNALTAQYLAGRAAGRKADLKAFLMDQRNIAGLGNIYVAEALFRAGLSPNRAASCLADRRGRPTQRAERLVPAIRQVLEDAIAAGGSTLKDYRAADGALGYFQHQFLVYGRAGEACARPGCRGIVRRSIQGGRSTFHCSACQR